MNFKTEKCISLVKSIVNKYQENNIISKFFYDTYYGLETPDINNVFLPHVLVWDPLSQVKVVEGLTCPLCLVDTKEKVSLKATDEWTEFQNNARIPRTIWDHSWFTILVGKIYICKNSHRLVSYHAGILKQLPFFTVPFLLTHDSGVSKKLYDSVIRMVEIGSSFKSIQTFIKEQYFDEYMRRKVLISQNFPLVQDSFNNLCPGVNTLIKWFMFHYENFKKSYEKYFDSISFDSLSFDHTFKIAANIGFTVENKWMRMYDSLFIVLNEKGLVKAFKFVKGTSLDNVKDIFSNLSTKGNPKHIYVDNCCNVSKILKTYFPQAEIKLDIFHAIQRLTKYMPKRHPFFSDEVKSIGLVFREDSDIGNARCLPTPTSEKILSKFEKFLATWKNVHVNDWKIVNQKVENEFRKLKFHIEKGCLSNIPVGMGTNQNESLHRFIKQFGRSRLSVQSAISIITSIFYSTNMRKRGHTTVPPIWSQFKCIDEGFSSHPCQFEVLPAEDFFCTEEQTDYCFQLNSDFSKIFFYASILYNINKKIPSDLQQKLYRFQTFTSLPVQHWNLQDFFKRSFSYEHIFLSDMRLILDKMSLSIAPCLDGSFMSTFLFIITEVLGFLKYPITFLQYIARFENNESGLLKLEDVLLEELQGFRKESYNYECQTSEPFKNVLNKNDEDLHGALISAFGNVFGVPIVVITTAMSLPMMPVLAENNLVETPIFILYDSSSKIIFPLIEVTANKNSDCICYCGQKKSADNLDKKNCSQNFRCTCLKMNKSCSHRCKCRNCGNNKPECTETFTRRKRIPHKMSEMVQLTTLQYLLQSDEPLDFVDTLQHFLLEACLYFILENMENNSFLSISSNLEEDLYQLYLEFYEEYTHSPHYNNRILFRPITKNRLSKWLKCRRRKSLLISQISTISHKKDG